MNVHVCMIPLNLKITDPIDITFRIHIPWDLDSIYNFNPYGLV